MHTSWSAEWRLALIAPRWAFRCYWRYLPLIGGLSLLPSVQRFVVVNWGEHIPSALAVASEIVVAGVRLLLIALIWRLAMRGIPLDWTAAGEFAREHWRSLVLQGGLLTVAFLIFGVLAENVVGGLLPESARQGYLAVLLFVKNPTIIAFTFVWMVGVIRQLLLSGAREQAHP